MPKSSPFMLFVALLYGIFPGMSSGLFAQSDRGRIVGVVIDSTGAILPKVVVTGTHLGTGFRPRVVTHDSGIYLLPYLPVGAFRITAQLSGFKTHIREPLVVPVAQTVRQDITLEVGEISQSVEVGPDTTLQTETSTVGTVIHNKQVVELPLNGRSFTELTLLVPGAVPNPNPTLLTSGTNVSVSGNRSENNNFTLDGINNNETFFKQFAVQPSIDAVEEFVIQTNVSSAEYGSAAGSQINIVTKSGNSLFHGSLFEFARNDLFDAQDAFALEKPRFRQNQFGGTFSGPLVLPGHQPVRDKTFFMVSYEGFRFRRDSNIFSTVPTAAMLAGDLSLNVVGKPAAPIYDPATTRPDPDRPGQWIRDRFPGNIIPRERLDPITALYAQRFLPAPNLPGQSANFLNTRSWSNDSDQFTARIDHKFSESNTLFGRFSYVDSEAFRPGPLPSVDNTLGNFFRNLVLSDTLVLNPATTLDFKLGYHRNHLQAADSAPDGLQGALDFLRVTGLRGVPVKSSEIPLYPQVNVAGLFGVSQSGFPFPDDTYQVLASLGRNMARHFLKIGMDLQHRRNMDDGLFSAIYTFTKDPTSDPQNMQSSGQSLAAFLLGLPNQAFRNLGDTAALMRSNSYHVYFQDDWKIISRLTLNLGLRYEYTQWPRHRDDKLASFDLETGEFIWAGRNPVTGEGPNTIPTIVPPDRNNVAPRFGLAYLLNPQTTLRGGYGIFYNSNFLWEAQGTRGNWPYAISQALTALNTLTPDSPLKTTFTPDLDIQPGSAMAPSAQHIVDRCNRVGYSQQWNLHLQHEVVRGVLLEVGYVGTKGTKLSIFLSGNDPSPGPGDANPRRPYPALGSVSLLTAVATSSYHGLQVKAEKKLSQGLSFLTSYTFSKAINIGGDGFGMSSSPQNARDLKAERALSAFHRRHNFVASYIYELPFGSGRRFLSSWCGWANHLIEGWEINGITTARAGQPINVTIPRDIANIGSRGFATRPNLLRDPVLENPSAALWFDTSAFAEPVPYTFGNAGRNVVTGPGTYNWTMGLFKNFDIQDRRKRIQLRAEAFNLQNHVNLTNPDTDFDSPTFGQILGAAPARQIQFGVKYLF
ncbi:MAG: TonB-dependent receptor [Acidobacteria bacterium]|nr:TonB-dependent receptor [Acidobacteriota bacterium]